MKQSINFSQFYDAFHSYDRSENFSYNGLRALFDYLEGYEKATGEEIELDVIGFCSEFSEYDSAVEAALEYGQDNLDEDKSSEYLHDNTMLIVFDGGIIIQDF